MESLKPFLRNNINIIVVDNASEDGTVEVVKKISTSSIAKIKIIANNTNEGFARANNKALRCVDTQHALLLNPDCKIEFDDIEKLIRKSNQFEEIAICSGTLTDKNGNREKSPFVKKPNKAMACQEIDDSKFISGCCMLIKMKLIEKIGLFDEGFFLYCEDNELCKRTLRNNYKLGICSDVEIFHKSQSSCEISQGVNLSILSHKIGWSKCYYTEKTHFKLAAQLRAIRDIARFYINNIFFSNNERDKLRKKASLVGCLNYLKGKRAFTKDGKPNLFKV